MFDTLSSVYDGGGQRVFETQRDVDRDAAKIMYVYDGGGQRVFETQPDVDVKAAKKCDTSSSVYDRGGQRVFETQTEVDVGAAKKYYVIHVDKLTQSHESVATQPTTH